MVQLPAARVVLQRSGCKVQYLGQTLHALPVSAMASLQVVQLSLSRVQTHTCMLIVRSRHSHHPQAVTENRWKDDNYSILILFCITCTANVLQTQSKCAGPDGTNNGTISPAAKQECEYTKDFARASVCYVMVW